MEENTEMSQAEWELQTKFIREPLPSQTEATRYKKSSLSFKILSERGAEVQLDTILAPDLANGLSLKSYTGVTELLYNFVLQN